MKRPIYLDYAATTPVDLRVAEAMCRCLTSETAFGNPASTSHSFGWTARRAVEEARAQVASLVNADPREIVWTSGATESNNLAIKGAAAFYHKKGRHLVTCKTEHKAVLDVCRYLQRQGWEVTYLDPEPTGLIDLKKLAAALRHDTVLVSIMQVNNETGIIQNIPAIGRLTRRCGVLLHVDAAQSAGKIPIDVKAGDVDLLSLSAHKLYGPKGIGALYVRHRPKVRIEAQMHGGGHEKGLRSGTLATHQIIGMGEACRIAAEEMSTEAERLRMLRDRLWAGLRDLGEVYPNGDIERCVPGILNLSFNFVAGESLLLALKDLAVSSGSACTSASQEPSHVLRALGRSPELADSAIRFSFGRFTTLGEIDHAVRIVRDVVNRLRRLSPLGDMHWSGELKDARTL